MPLGTTAAILLGIGAVGAGVAASSMTQPPKMSSPTPLPQPPSVSNAQTTAQNISQKRTSDITQTVYTGPLGIQDQANVAKKVLLGQ